MSSETKSLTAPDNASLAKKRHTHSERTRDEAEAAYTLAHNAYTFTSQWESVGKKRQAEQTIARLRGHGRGTGQIPDQPGCTALSGRCFELADTIEALQPPMRPAAIQDAR